MIETFSIRSTRVLVGGAIRAASVRVGDEGVISAVDPYEAVPASRAIDVGELVLMPGVIDTHVHVNEPGRTEWEGFETATRAAAAGGITTIVDMPLNSIPATTSVEALEAKRAAARPHARVNAGFWGGVVPGNAGEILPLARAGVLGFKCFLVPSGVDEFPHVTDADLRIAAPALAESGLPLLVHAEAPDAIDTRWAEAADARSYSAYLASRPPAAERRAIEMMASIAREAGNRAGSGLRIHIVHVSSASGVDAIRAAQRDGLAMTGETCPHYLFACEDEVAASATPTLWKCAPPIRTAADRDALWSGLAAGVLSLVASDHSPSPRALKCVDTGDLARAWGGIASLQLALPIVWTSARVRGYAVADVARWMTRGPATLAGLLARRGTIAPGMIADLIAWDPDAIVRLDPSALQHRHAVTPYAGLDLRGRVERTWVRGVPVFDRGAFADARPGQLLNGSA